MHTEDEARELWCPMVRYERESAEPSFNRCRGNDGVHNNPPDPCRCIASQCAMWRWHQTEAKYRGAGDTFITVKGIGYCGLAGKPVVV
jgi:hypothetical protein